MSEIIDIKKENTRPCLIYDKYNREWKAAFFHMWMKRKRRYADEPKEVLCAVVELEDGFVTDVYAGHIRFTDRNKSEFETDLVNDDVES